MKCKPILDFSGTDRGTLLLYPLLVPVISTKLQTTSASCPFMCVSQCKNSWLNSIDLWIYKTFNPRLMLFSILFFLTCHVTPRTSTNTPPHTVQMMTADSNDFDLEAVGCPVVDGKISSLCPVDDGKISSLCEALNELLFLNKEPIYLGVNINFSTFSKWAIGQFIRRRNGWKNDNTLGNNWQPWADVDYLCKWQPNEKNRLRIPTGRRQTSWPRASAAKQLNQRLPGTNPAGGQSETGTRGHQISSAAL